MAEVITSQEVIESVSQGQESVDCLQRAQVWLKERGNDAPLCCCKAHSCEDEHFYSIVSVLVMIQPPLTDDSGEQLALALLPF